MPPRRFCSGSECRLGRCPAFGLVVMEKWSGDLRRSMVESSMDT
ncbi:hypothetical protein LHK_02175 [Laribacter hongkongensis HLHK9]|uniref:Uncharacterized protein n=1 Tax=Laribacter hongkongensis (strain HLHK9) TaxID=557598 RepID=C1D9Q7_LARHH|nr:hypothetical protein LHK_02175 [Laribacter hongkongensis HLHK9]